MRQVIFCQRRAAGGGDHASIKNVTVGRVPAQLYLLTIIARSQSSAILDELGGVMRRDRQLELPRPVVWGGRRKGAGRKRGERALVLHRRRPEHKARYPVHVTLRALPDVGSLRAWRAFHAAEGAIARASRSGFRVVHYSVQGDHVHAIVEAPDKRTLAAGVQG